MNQRQRRKLCTISNQLYTIRDQLEELLTTEQEKRDNMSDCLQSTPQYEDIDAACCALEDALLSLDDALEMVDVAAL